MPRTHPIAVVGLGALFPGAATTASFWSDIVAGRDRLTDVPRTHWLAADYFDERPGTPDKVYTARGGFLPEVDFSPMEFGLPPSVLPATDTAQLLALVVAKRALAEATQGRYEAMDRSRVSVILGVASATELVAHMAGRLQIPVVARAMRAAGVAEEDVARVVQTLGGLYTPWQEGTFPGLLGNVVAGRIASRLDLGGTNVVVDAACAGSLAAVSAAVSELELGHADLCITGGVDSLNDILMFMCFAQTGALSRSGDCRPYSLDADGTMLGEGVGLLALRRLGDAERAGDRIYAVLRGIGSSSDGRANSIYAPRAEGQALALRRAYERAGVGPEEVELVEGHGTGTRAGDAVELEALRAVYDAAGARPHSCALGSVKSQIGHTKAAAGAAGLIKAVLALHHRVLPPTIKVTEPLPLLQDGASPFYLSTHARPWFAREGRPRRAAVSSFGFGGTNFHAVVEEYSGPAPRPDRLRAVPSELVVFHAADRAGLVRVGRSRLEAKAAGGPGAFAREARRSQLAFEPRAGARLAVVAVDEADLLQQLRGALDRVEKSDEPFSTPGGLHFRAGPSAGPVALLFPGQGSQSLGMGGDLAIHFDDARRVWDRVTNCVAEAGTRLTDVVHPPPAFREAETRATGDRLTATRWAQPAIAVTSFAALALLQRVGVAPACVAGHSLGEVTALAASGVLDLASLAAVARRRGELMAEASAGAPGAMIAVASDLPKVRELLAARASEVVVANHNAPDQVVLSGPLAAIEELEGGLASEGIGSRRLPVSTAFHSPLVAGACEPFRRFLDDVPIGAPRVPVYANATAAPYPSEASAVRDAVARAIAQPVRFVDQIEAMYAAGARVFVEVGPGAILTGLAARCLDGRPHVALSLDRPGKHGVTALWDALARLATAGVPLLFAPLWEGVALEPDLDATPRPKGVVRLTGANYKKPYPPPSGDITPNLPARETPPSPGFPVASPPPPIEAHVAGAQIDAWERAALRLQEPVIAAQREYQRLMAESHQAFLRAMQASFGGASSSVADAPAPTPHPIVAATVPEARPVATPSPSSDDAPAKRAAAPSARPAPPERAPSAEPGRARPTDMVPLMLAIVAEKTGYPPEMIDLTMDLEADLGIDSIKRVEILAAARERITGLPEVDAARLATLRTLRAILDALAPQVPSPLPSATSGSPAPARPDRAPRAFVSVADLTPITLAIVAEKTGYPAEMIELTMDLEADLGIDSIKRVEILSALRQRVPGLPEADPARLAKLRTLAQILDFVGGAGAGGSPDANGAERVSDAARTDGSGRTNGADGASATAVAAFAAEPARAAEAARGIVRLERAPVLGLATPGLVGGARVCILPDDAGVASAVARRLAALGMDGAITDQVPPDARVMLFLGGFRDVSTVEDAVRVQREAFEAARTAARSLQRGGTFIVVQDTGGDFGSSGDAGGRAWLAGLGALAKTAAREWPDACARVIDVARGGRDAEAVAAAVVGELLAGGSDPEIGLSARGDRFRPVVVEAAIAESTEQPIDEGAPFVVTGGARGVTAACVLALARAARPRLLLLGRTPLTPEPACFDGVSAEAELKAVVIREAARRGEPATPRQVGRAVDAVLACREATTTMGRLAAMGIDARYAAVDVRDRTALDRVLTETRAAWGPIRGVVHGAGVVADALLETRPDAAAFDRVFDTKVVGLRALLDATASDPLSWLCLFSSVAARGGNAGQADYAMANEVLNKVAGIEARRRGAACRVVSMGWGPWAGGMVTPALRRHFTSRGVPLLELGEGARAFVRELRASEGERAAEVLVAASLLPFQGAAPLRAQVHVTRAAYPELASHRIRGAVVLPVAIVLEWFARAARSWVPSARSVHLRDLSVVRGVQLLGYEGEGDVFTVLATPADDTGRMALELCDRDGARRYTAVFDPSAPAAREPIAFAAGLEASQPFPGALYGPSALFHGPHLQVLRRVERLSDERARAASASALDAGWSTESWCTDPVGIDAALQLAFLFGLQSGVGQTLPMRIERFVQHGAPRRGELRCTLRQRARSRERCVVDLLVAHEDGAPQAELVGVEMFAVPSGTASA